MANYSTSEFKAGLKIIVDGSPCSIVENEFIKPGKGQAFNRVRMRNLMTGQVWDKIYKSGEKLEAADVLDIEAQYLYTDGELWHFMNNDGSYEQLAARGKALDTASMWIQEGDICAITLFNGDPISVEAPQTVDIEVSETDPGLKGDTVSGGTKPAVLVTGAKVKVPLFVRTGEKVRVNTRTGEYLSRSAK